MKPRLTALLVTICALPLIVAGCGGDDPSSDANSPEAKAVFTAATASVDALTGGDAKRFCRGLSPTYVKENLKNIRRCAKSFGVLLKQSSEDMGSIKIGEVTIEGERARAQLLKADGEQQGEIYLIRENGEWHTTLSPAPEKPEAE